MGGHLHPGAPTCALGTGHDDRVFLHNKARSERVYVRPLKVARSNGGIIATAQQMISAIRERSTARSVAISLLLAATVTLVVALVCRIAAARVTNELPAYVHIRWAADVGAAARARLEQQFSLTHGALKEGTVYGYYVTDVSEANLRQLVQHTAVADTHEIDRRAFRIAPTAVRLAGNTTDTESRRVLLEHAAVALGAVGAVMFALGAFVWIAPGVAFRAYRDSIATTHGGLRALLRWISTRPPDATPEAVAVFRMLFGVGAIFLLTIDNPVNPDSLAVIGPWVTPWLVTWGGLFVAGLYSRAAYIALLLGVVAWVAATRPHSHVYAAFFITLLCLLPSRWGDAWSVDAWRRARQQRPLVAATPKQYGYVVWVLAAVLGVLFFAAAIAKLERAGLSWITNGTVKYHFLTDSAQAPVDWGVRLAAYHPAAVLLSLAGLATEALVLPAVLSRRHWLRAIAGVAAATLLAGFHLFQGVFWPGWWLLLLGFLPWHRIGSVTQPSVGSAQLALSPLQLGFLVALAVQQVVASAFSLEIRPLLSTYDMYSTSYTDQRDYEQKTSRFHRLVGLRDDSAIVSCDITSDEADDIAAALRENRELGPVSKRCFPETSRIESVTVEVDRADVDWEHWRLRGRKQVILAGPSRLAGGQ